MALGLDPAPLVVFSETTCCRPDGSRGHELQHARSVVLALAPEEPEMAPEHRKIGAMIQPLPQMMLASHLPDGLVEGALEGVL